MFKKLLVAVLLSAALPALIFAQSSGKIAGVVKDKATGDPLPGVNIVVEGTSQGSASDVDGYFVILNVPVGVVNLRATYIGYKDVVIEGVRVSAGITSEVNFEMSPTTLELEEAVVVTAKRPLIEKNTTSSVSLVTDEQLENIPIRGFTNLFATQNSVIVQNGVVHIRGGRGDEVGYYIDGASANTILSNTRAVGIIQEALEEFQVLAGGYTAEFGGANSGIIRAELKTGTPDYHFSIDYQTDQFANEGHKFLDTYSYKQHITVATLSGPLLNKKIRFFVAGENNFQGDPVKRFSRGFTIDDFFAPGTPKADRVFVDSNPSNANVAKGNPDVITALNYPAGFTPKNLLNRYTANGTLLFDYQPIRVRLSGSYTHTRSRTNSAPMLTILDNRQNFRDSFSYLTSAKITHVLSPKTFYNLTFSFFHSKGETKDDYFGNDWKKWYDSTAVANFTKGKVIYRDRYRPQFAYRFNGFPFNREGTPSAGYNIQNQTYLGGALDLVSQVGRYNEVKIGGDFRYYTMRNFSVRASAISLLGDKGVSKIEDLDVGVWKTTSVVNNYGYDIYGNESSDTKYDASGQEIAAAPKNPVFGSAYIQDKIEFNDIIVQAGLRLDVFDSDDRILTPRDNPPVNNKTQTLKPEAFKPQKTFKQVSPRLGFSFPVTDRTKFYLQYGKFIQMPQLGTVYVGTNIYDRQYVRDGFAFLNPAGFGLEPIRTTSYEMGFAQQLSSVAAIDISGFYKNVQGQVQTDRVFADPTFPGASQFNILVNGDFATTKGLEFRLTVRRVKNLQAQVNYTFTNAKGTGSNRLSFVGATERVSEKPTVISPLDFSQAHTGSIILDYRFPKNNPLSALRQLGLNALFTFNSGHPYTRANPLVGGQTDPFTAGTDFMTDTRTRKAAEAQGNSRTPWNFNLDLRLDKTFNFTQNLQGTLYLRINNLTNRKNVLNVFQNTGTPDDDGFLSNRARSQATIDANGGDTYVRQYQIINLDNGQAYWNQLGLQLYGTPRQIFLGFKLSY